MPVASSQVAQKEAKKTSPYRVVREVLDDVREKGGYNLKEIDRVADEIVELAWRINKIHAISEKFRNVTLSPHVATMLKLAGKHRLVEGSKP